MLIVVVRSHCGMDGDHLLTMMLYSKIPLDEPFLRYRLAIIIGEENKGLQEGKIPISDTYYLMGTSDPTGTLGPNQVCVIL
jgi:RNA-dependent RNA polymerase